MQGFRAFRAHVLRLLAQIGNTPRPSDDELIHAWLDDRTAAEFAFAYAERLGVITLTTKGARR